MVLFLRHHLATSGVGGAPDVEEAGLVDMGVALGGGEAGVAEKLLDGAQIGAAGQQVGCEGVPQGVGRRVLRQTGQAPEYAQRARCDGGIEPLAARADEQGGGRVGGGWVPFQPIGTGTSLSLRPLPMTRSGRPACGASRTSSASASAIRSPVP